MFEAGRDQAAGLRQLFPSRQPCLLPLGCTPGDARERAGVEAIVRALTRLGRRPLLVDLLGGAAVARRPSYAVIDANAMLPSGANSHELGQLLDALAQRAPWRSFDVAIVAAEPLRLADLSAGLADRIVLATRAGSDGLTRTYSQIKAMHLAHGFRSYCTVFVDAASQAAAIASHRRLADAAARFLGAAIEFGGARDALDEGHIAADALRWSQPLPSCASSTTH
ncbi:MAG: hypothetical protein ROZ64_01965 [Burkholderiaceae bacterium]|nr:hypothetical protein [Burkholderiaceae bacterium]